MVLAAVVAGAWHAAEPVGAAEASEPRLNVLLITVDDMSCDSVGAFGCELPGATPNIRTSWM